MAATTTAAAASSNVCSCADLAASNRALRQRCADLEAENSRLRDLLQAASNAAAASVSASASASASTNGDVAAAADATASAATAATTDEDGELTIEEILRSTAQEMAKEAAEAAAAAAPATAGSIEAELKAAAEEALGNQGYVYDERTGLYYDTGTGFYYDPTEQLFYNSRTGVYYTYSSETQQYVYHSRVALSELKEQAELIALMSGAQHRPPPKQQQQQRHSALLKPRGDASDSGGGDSGRRSKRMRKSGSRGKKSRQRKRSRSRHRRRSRSDSSRSSNFPAGSEGECEASDDSGGRSAMDMTAAAADAVLAPRGRGHALKRKKRHREEKKQKKRKKEAKRRLRQNYEASPADAAAVTVAAEAEQEHYPPCIRMLVLESPSLAVGSLHVVTRDGATIGRDPAALPTLLLAGDPDVSKLHCRILYCEAERQFQAVDMASHSGTCIGGRRICLRREISQPAQLWHGCRLRVGGTEFLCHIHQYPGDATCSRCEPGLAQLHAPGPSNNPESAAATDALQPQQLPLDRRARLRQLKAKHGLLASAAQPPATAYVDRAEARRRRVGLDSARRLPGDIDASAAVSSAVATAEAAGLALHQRDADNPGVRLLSRMGWRPGDGIGQGARAEQGLREPLAAAPRLAERAGLGSEFDRPATAAAFPASEAELRRARIAMATKERYSQLLLADQTSGPAGADWEKPA